MKLQMMTRRFMTFGLALLAVAGATALAPSIASAQDDTGLPTSHITITLSDSPIRSALDALFKSAGVNYTIDPTITGNVTAVLNNVPFETALKTILRGTTPPLTYTKENGIYQISQQAATVQAASAAPAASATAPAYTGQQASATKQAVVIYLNYVSGALLNYVVGPVTVIPPLLTTPGASGANGGTGGAGGSSAGGIGGSSGGLGGSMGGSSIGGGGASTTF